ncbi:bacterial bifunctional deaminase-reductase [Saccharata proteae CBS 121410]|uniref:2,5-diamino-6-ribosylamino-4(3H)-pyrimidinone 5'-phosphate reductase n=1 Tax=Saccharata proteae CBS 121410 TaxID=1314787 RepID=A0A9P4M378_9PEZI|nr:bacterial bifunctional deaminase-reductase [Saccharata proteae CBS 121410]
MAAKARDVLHLPSTAAEALAPYLPASPPAPALPFTTLTFATSLDSALSLAPGTQTALSGPQSKAMTHYLRSKHQGILVGVGTAEADDPSLNCRIEGVGGYGGEGLAGQPRPVVVDPAQRWVFAGTEKGFAKCLRLALAGQGLAPWVVVAEETGVDEGRRMVLEETCGGKIVRVRTREDGKMAWRDVLAKLREEGMESVMVEGGAGVINRLLEPDNLELVNSVIVTIAPTWLGQGGVVVSPARRVDGDEKPLAAARLEHVRWLPMEEDVVLCGKLMG